MKKIISILSILSFIACKDSKNISTTNNLELKKKLVVKKNVKMPIKEDVHYKSWQIHITEKNNTTYLSRKNYYRNSIIKYNWDTKKRVETFLFKKEGPNRVSKFDSAAFLELEDSLFLIATGRSKIYLVKNDSVIFNKRFDETGKGFGNIMNGFNRCLPVRIDDCVLIFKSSEVARNDKTFYTYSQLVKFNLETKMLKECSVKFPEVYKIGECWGFRHLKQSFTLNNSNEIIISFPLDYHLYRYDIKNDTIYRIDKNTMSIFKTPFISMPCKDIYDRKVYYYYEKKSARYESITYDKFRDIYYRIVLFPPEGLTKKNAQDLDYTISIMVLDDKFNVIAEDLLPENTYDYDDFFITEEGFWLSRNHPKNPDFNEEVMNFDLFTLTDKK